MNVLTNIEIEQGLLSTLVTDNEINFSIATDGLTTECFSSPAYQRLFTALKGMVEKGVSIYEPTLVIDAYNRTPPVGGKYGGATDSISIPQYLDLVAPSTMRLDIAENVPQYVRVLMDLANRRRMLRVYQDAAQRITDMTVEASETTAMSMKQIVDSTALESNGVISFSEAQQLLQEGINRNLDGTSPASFPTGFKSLDICGGLHPGNLVVIAALSSHGKTALAMTMVSPQLPQPSPQNPQSSSLNPQPSSLNLQPSSLNPKVAYFSMEMTPRELMARYMARYSGVASNALMYKRLSDQELVAVQKAKDAVSVMDDRMFFFEMAGSSVESISQSIRFLHASKGINIVVIDYLQILGLKAARGETRESVIARAARDFKNLAKQLGIVIILLSQMNRDSTQGRVPNVNRIRDSGEINESADVTLILWRPEQENDPVLSYPARWETVDTHGTALVTIAKDRNGGTGGPHEFIIGFNPKLTYFHDLATLPQKHGSTVTNSDNSNPW